MHLNLARVYWAEEAQLTPLTFPVFFQGHTEPAVVNIIDIAVPNSLSVQGVIDATGLTRWWLVQGGEWENISGVILDSSLAHLSTDLFSALHHFFTEQPDRLPVISREEMDKRPLLDHFIDQISALHEFTYQLTTSLRAHTLIEFHTRYKMQFLAYSQPAYRELGPLIANIKHESSLTAFAHQYRQRFMQLMREPATIKNHTNVIMHLQGYFRHQVSDELRQQLNTIIHRYRLGECHLEKVKETLRTYQQMAPHDWLGQQRYLYPWLYDQPITTGDK